MMDGNNIELSNLLTINDIKSSQSKSATDSTIFSEILSQQLEERIPTEELATFVNDDEIKLEDEQAEEKKEKKTEKEDNINSEYILNSFAHQTVENEKIRIPLENNSFESNQLKEKQSFMQNKLLLSENISKEDFIKDQLLNTSQGFLSNKQLEINENNVESIINPMISTKEKVELFQKLEESHEINQLEITEKPNDKKLGSIFNANRSLTNDKKVNDYLLVNDSNDEDDVRSKDFQNKLDINNRGNELIEFNELEFTDPILTELKQLDEEKQNNNTDINSDKFNQELVENINIEEPLMYSPIKEVVENNGIELSELKEIPNKSLEVKNFPEITKSIISEVESMNYEESKSFKLTLQPENLGELEVILEMKDGKLSTQFIVPDNHIKELMDTNLVNFQKNLLENNIVIEKINVVVEIPTQTTFDLSGDLNHRQNQKHQSFKTNKLSQQYDKTEEFEEISLIEVNDSVNILV